MADDMRGQAPDGRRLRVRLTLIASLVTATVLALASVALVLLFRQSLVANADELSRSRAADLVRLADRGALPETLTNVGEEGVAQVVDGDGQVLAASGNVQGRPPLTSRWPSGDEPRSLRLENAPDDDETEDYRVWAVRGDVGGSPIVAYVGSGPEAVSEPVGSLVRSLALAAPLLLAALTCLVWYLVGRILRPLAAAHARQRAFVADASHELQGPLAALRTELEVALDHPESTDWPRVGRLVLDDSDRMERLVRDLLFLAREEATKVEARPVDLDDVVLEEASRLRRRSALAVDTRAVSAAPVRGSRDELARATRNLLDNAARYAASTVTVSAGVGADGAVELAVADDGPGVPPEHQPHIFERFYRADAARTAGDSDGGTGLGLAIVRSVAERHGGTVRLDGSRGGARFVLRLPMPT